MRSVSLDGYSLGEKEQAVMQFAVQVGAFTVTDLISNLSMDEGDANRAIFRLTKNYIPFVNRVGLTDKFQLSSQGRKMMGVSDAPPLHSPIAPPASPFDPKPRGQLITHLKHKPCSASELSRLTGLTLAQVHHGLKTLAARGLMGRAQAAARDRRVMMYQLKTYEEPAKPVLTPALVPLTDPSDWHTWAERLLWEGLGGPKIIEQEQEQEQEQTRNVLPKFMIVGGRSDLFARLKKRFDTRAKLYFRISHDDGLLSTVCEGMDHVFVMLRICSHKMSDAVKKSRASYTYIHGWENSAIKAIEEQLAKRS